MNELTENIAPSVEAISDLILIARSNFQTALEKQPTSITSEVVDGRDEIVISWTSQSMESPPVDIVTITRRFTGLGQYDTAFSDALELIKNSSTTSDSRSETDE